MAVAGWWPGCLDVAGVGRGGPAPAEGNQHRDTFRNASSRYGNLDIIFNSRLPAPVKSPVTFGKESLFLNNNKTPLQL